MKLGTIVKHKSIKGTYIVYRESYMDICVFIEEITTGIQHMVFIEDLEVLS